MAHWWRLKLPGAVLNLGGIIDAGHMVDDDSLSFDPEYMLLTGDVLKALQTVISPRASSATATSSSSSTLIVHKFSESEMSLLSMLPKFSLVSAIRSHKSAHQGIQLNMSREELLVVVRDTLSSYVANGTDYSADTPFMNMGIDSLSLSSIAAVLSAKLVIDVSPPLLFAYPTATRLIDHFISLSSTTTAKKRRPLRGAATVTTTNTDDIAIVSMSYRLPGGVNSAKSFWSALMHDVDLVALSQSTSRQRADGLTGAFLTADDVECFDHAFFGISLAEAQSMDPAQRLMLTTCWEALYNAGHRARDEVAGQSMGVFLGIGGSDFTPAPGAPLVATSMAISIAANRVSYVFGIHGPSMAIDTACSSALVAFDQAVVAIGRGECDSAIVGGVNLMFDERTTQSFVDMGVVSPTMRCHSFDAEADGYERAEGCGVLVLMRASDARHSGFPILAVCQGSAVRSNGGGMSLTAPVATMQAEAMRASLHVNRTEASSVAVLEAHGTGTRMGDAVEFDAIRQAFVDDHSRPHPLVVTTAKSTTGHTEAASSAISLIKAFLSMVHRRVPRNIHLNQPNPMLNLDDVSTPAAAHVALATHMTMCSLNQPPSPLHQWAAVSLECFHAHPPTLLSCTHTADDVLCAQTHVHRQPPSLRVDDHVDTHIPRRHHLSYCVGGGGG